MEPGFKSLNTIFLFPFSSVMELNFRYIDISELSTFFPYLICRLDGTLAFYYAVSAETLWATICFYVMLIVSFAF